MVWGVEEPPPPHDTNEANSSTIVGATRTGSRLRVRIHRQADPISITIQRSGIAPGGKTTWGKTLVVIGAVVVILTVTGCAVALAICSVALDKPQVGAGVTAGVMVQLSATVPLNAAIGVRTSPNFAACPALTVWEVDAPEAEVIEKFGTGLAVVLSSTPSPLKNVLPQGKTISGSPSPFISATRTARGARLG